MLTKILNILALDITISVTPEKFSFKRGDTEIEFTTKLYLSLEQKKPKIFVRHVSSSVSRSKLNKEYFYGSII